MHQTKNLVLLLFTICILDSSCGNKIKESTDAVYSRHLQRKVDLSIFAVNGKEKEKLNLLIFLMEEKSSDWNLAPMLDSLHKTGSIRPVLIVGVQGMKDEFGLSASKGRQEYFHRFLANELLPYIRKKTAVRKFESVAVCGAGNPGLSAFDLAWHESEKIHKLGIFSILRERIPDVSPDSSGLNMFIRSSRKRPELQYWLYAGMKNDSLNYDHTNSLVKALEKKTFVSASDIHVNFDPAAENGLMDWKKQMPAFLVWAFGK